MPIEIIKDKLLVKNDNDEFVNGLVIPDKTGLDNVNTIMGVENNNYNSIAENLTDIFNDCNTKIVDKGGIEADNVANLPSAIESIESGGNLPFEISYVDIGETKTITAEEIINLYAPQTNPMDVILIYANNNSNVGNAGNMIWAFRTSDNYLVGQTRRGGDTGAGTNALGHQWNVSVGATLKIVIIPNDWRFE